VLRENQKRGFPPCACAPRKSGEGRREKEETLCVASQLTPNNVCPEYVVYKNLIEVTKITKPPPTKRLSPLLLLIPCPLGQHGSHGNTAHH